MRLPPRFGKEQMFHVKHCGGGGGVRGEWAGGRRGPQAARRSGGQAGEARFGGAGRRRACGPSPPPAGGRQKAPAEAGAVGSYGYTGMYCSSSSRTWSASLIISRT